MIFCSIDLALSTTGLCIYDTDLVHKVVHYEKISTKYGTIKKQSETQRMVYVIDNIMQIIKRFNAKSIVVEDQFVGFKTSSKTTMTLSRIRGALEYASSKENILVTSINNASIKKNICEIAGIKSDSSKETVARAVQLIFKDNEYVKSIGAYSDSQSKAKTSDIYDAVALAVIYDYKR